MTNEELARKYAGCEYCKSKDKCTNDPEERCCDYNLTEEIAEIKDKQFENDKVKVPAELYKKIGDYIETAKKAVAKNEATIEMLDEAVSLIKEIRQYVPDEVINNPNY